MSTKSARSKRTKSHRSSQYDCPDSAGAGTAAASRSASLSACSRRRDTAAAAAILSRRSGKGRGRCPARRRLQPFRVRSQWEASARPRRHAPARPHPRDGLARHVTGGGDRWWRLVTVGGRWQGAPAAGASVSPWRALLPKYQGCSGQSAQGLVWK